MRLIVGWSGALPLSYVFQKKSANKLVRQG